MSIPWYRRTGFTLIEVVVVILVIGILAALVAPRFYRDARDAGDARPATAKAQIETLRAALDAYRLDNGAYPTSAQGLAALRTRPTIDPPASWRQPYLQQAVPVDPWGHEYLYQSPGTVNPAAYDLQSLGADGRPGGEGENADILSSK